VNRNVPLAQAGMDEVVLPARVQEALGQLVGAAKEGLLALSVGVGLGVLAELMEDEVDQVVGPKGKHDPGRAAVRHGHESGEVTLGGRRVQVERPRVRSADGLAELPLRTYAQASSICASSHSPSSRAGFWPSQSRAGESDESYRYVFGGFFFLNCACVPTSGRRSASSLCAYAADSFLPLVGASSDSFVRDAFASYCHLSVGGKKESVDFRRQLMRLDLGPRRVAGGSSARR
jgi:hypothetical protein